MSLKNLDVAALLFLLIVPAAVQAQSADDENSRLRAEIATLKSRNAVLERACPTAVSANSSAVGTPSASTPAASNQAAAPAAPQPTAATVAVSEPPQNYSHAGCDRSLFSGPPPGKWQDSKAWSHISKGMTMAAVEAALGVEHFDENRDDAVQWQYGRCNSGWKGSVTFKNDLVVSVSAPE
jgi:hypothetical protein